MLISLFDRMKRNMLISLFDRMKRKYPIANLGSNPAYYGFLYQEHQGINLSVGRSGLDMDLELLKNYCCSLHSHATIIIPIMPFYSILGNAEETMTQSELNVIYRHISKESRKHFDVFIPPHNTPFWIRARQILSKIVSRKKDRWYEHLQHPFTYEWFENNAEEMCNYWKHEFNIEDLESLLSQENRRRRQFSIIHLNDLINYCKQQEYKPVLLLMPMTNHLLKHFNNTFRNTYIYSFVNPIANAHQLELLDYMGDNRFINDELYCNSLFLNKRGAQLFTEQVLKDLNITVS